MDEGFSWRCPFCQQHATITGVNRDVETVGLRNSGVDGHKIVSLQLITCPNAKCRKYQLQAWLYEGRLNGISQIVKALAPKDKPLRYWALIPDADAVVFPDYVPAPIREDYTEACRIAALSPKAAATLARRCLQGMIRDVWKVKKKNLAAAIEAIKKRIDPDAWKAIEGVRTVGNIGAHMEKDVNVIVPVEPKEAVLLVRLIEALVDDWYVKPHERAALYQGVISVAGAKALVRKGAATPAGTQAATPFQPPPPTPPPPAPADSTAVQPSNALKS